MRTEDPSVLSALNLLNVFIQTNPKTRFPSLYGGNTVFASNGEKDTRSIQPLEIWMGIFQSVRPTIDRIVINVDTTVGVVVPVESLNSFCEKFLKFLQTRTPNRQGARSRDQPFSGLSQISDRDFQSLRTFLRGIKISVKYAGRPERTGKIKDLVRDVGNVEFTQKSGQTTTVASHFREANNIIIPPQSLGIRVGNHELFPVQVCRTVNQLYKNKIPPEFTPEVLKFLPPNPESRLKKITQAWNDLEYKHSQFLQGANIDFMPSASPMQVKGRLLPSPTIVQGGEQTQRLRESGTWNMQQTEMAIAADPIEVWSCVNFTGTKDPQVTEFIRDLCQVMSDRGIVCQSPRYVSAEANTIERTLTEEIRGRNPKLMVVFLPDMAPELYIRVKRFGDIDCGIATQCIRWSPKLRNATPNRRNQYQNNLLLKINTRLGGINFAPQNPAMKELQSQLTMILGADVSHPSPGSTLPSVAALVSSHDPYACKYTASVRLQTSRVEIIQDLEAMVLEAIKTFVHNNNGNPPKRLIYFRDGVSEGQFNAVHTAERQSFKRALLKSGYFEVPPKFTLIICGKKHHIRFFPDSKNADPKGNKNFPAGFIGDRDIGHPLYDDFYLQSQKGLQGTSRPCHYTVLARDEAWDMDMIQQITYTLCYCYSRATRSVKIPAPVYYADLVCGRAKFHYDGDVDFEDDGSVSADDPDYMNRQFEFYESHFRQVHPNLVNSDYSMYFV
ncbi:Piwi domain-containing protein [Mycena crocata]|nr:Piwi domain-containing protein [Mycena crocata]